MGEIIGTLYASDLQGHYFLPILKNVLKFNVVPNLKSIILANVSHDYNQKDTH